MGKESLEDVDKCGRPSTATTDENIAHVHRVVMDDRCLTVNQIANTVDISREKILHNELGMSKVSSRWVPRLSTPDQRLTRLTLSQANLAIFKQTKLVFLTVF